MSRRQRLDAEAKAKAEAELEAKLRLDLRGKCIDFNGKLDLALLLDGLQDEREQGITIDVAHRYINIAMQMFE